MPKQLMLSGLLWSVLLQEGTWVGQGELRRKDGSIVLVSVRVVELITPTATFYQGMFRERTPTAD